MLKSCSKGLRLNECYNAKITVDFADEDRIEQALINFHSNALKYASKSKEISLNITNLESIYQNNCSGSW